MPAPAPDGSADGRTYRAADIKRFLASAFMAFDVLQEDATTVAELMLRADLYGYDTHGKFRLR